MARLGWGTLTEPFLFTFNSICHFLKKFTSHLFVLLIFMGKDGTIAKL